MVSNTEEALNKIPLKSVSDDEEKNGGEFARDIVASAEESRREAKYVFKVTHSIHSLQTHPLSFLLYILLCFFCFLAL